MKISFHAVFVLALDPYCSGDLCTCHLEISNCLLYHAQYDQALVRVYLFSCHKLSLSIFPQSHLKLARQSAGIGLELSGAMGKRTKFQQAETAQLILKVSHFNGDDVTPSNSDESPSNQNLPKVFSLISGHIY